MKNCTLVFLILFLAVGCRENNENLSTNSDTEESETVNQYFTDSTSLGKSGQFRVKICQKQNPDGDNWIMVETAYKEQNTWHGGQVFNLQSPPVASLDVRLEDFNNDGRKDISFISGTAVNPQNQIRSLIVSTDSSNLFAAILNSADFPNLRYNDELNCLDAWLLYGGSTTVFLKIEGDSLKEFAGVELHNDTRTVYEIDEYGNKNVLQTEQVKDLDVNTRYKTYKPLKARF